MKGTKLNECTKHDCYGVVPATQILATALHKCCVVALFVRLRIKRELAYVEHEVSIFDTRNLIGTEYNFIFLSCLQLQNVVGAAHAQSKETSAFRMHRTESCTQNHKESSCKLDTKIAR